MIAAYLVAAGVRVRRFFAFLFKHRWDVGLVREYEGGPRRYLRCKACGEERTVRAGAYSGAYWDLVATLRDTGCPGTLGGQ